MGGCSSSGGGKIERCLRKRTVVLVRSWHALQAASSFELASYCCWVRLLLSAVVFCYLLCGARQAWWVTVGWANFANQGLVCCWVAAQHACALLDQLCHVHTPEAACEKVPRFGCGAAMFVVWEGQHKEVEQGVVTGPPLAHCLQLVACGIVKVVCAALQLVG